MPNYSGVWRLQEAVDAIAVGLWPEGPLAGDIGILAGEGYGGNTIQYITITSTGNTTDWGDMTRSRASFEMSASVSLKGAGSSGICSSWFSLSDMRFI